MAAAATRRGAKQRLKRKHRASGIAATRIARLGCEHPTERILAGRGSLDASSALRQVTSAKSSIGIRPVGVAVPAGRFFRVYQQT